MDIFKEISGLDRLLHEPARLAVMTALSNCMSADFIFLQSLTGLSKGNLSSHLSKLEDAGMILAIKSYRGKTPNTSIRITGKGSSAIMGHWEKLESIRAESKKADLRKKAVSV